MTRPLVRHPPPELGRPGALLVVALGLTVGVTAQDRARADTGMGSAEPARQAARLELARASAPSGPVVVTIGERKVDAGTVSRALGSWQTPEGGRYDLQGLVAELVRRELFSRFARERGFDRGYAVEQAMRHFYEKKMLRRVQKQARGTSEVPPAELKAYFESHQDDFLVPPRRRVAAIVLSTRSAAEEMLQRALEVDTEGWAALVRENNGGRGGRGRPVELAGYLGEVKPVSKGLGHPRVPKEVQAAAFDISMPGQVYSKVVQSKERFYIVKLLSVTRGSMPPRKQVEHLVRERILGDRVARAEAKFEADMKKRFPVRIVTENLKLLETL